MGLPKVHRLTNWRDFRAVYEGEIRRYSPNLILRALSTAKNNSASEPTKIGISIGKKVSKKAVVRNRIKRQIKGAIRELLPAIAPNWKVVIVVKPSAVKCKYEHFLRELNELLIKTKIINGH
ncbi:ribonuclease P protein component [Myxosarcina sp. GI1]|uniref:ribonuclease P protein component n=1 Tax=Myxosarcina sp. GI1 TaxID=1541065 RepID=UPI0005654038|nr:ribonuclease P protein component [Myxosarcina sp. GI1]